MRNRSLVLLALLPFATTAAAIDRWIPIAGTVGVFHTDVRLLNPSTVKEIEITARFFPAGNADNSDAAAGEGVKFSIPKRGMRVLDDVTTHFNNTTQLGAIRFTSPDEFTATSRIFAQTSSGTLGQSFVAESTATAQGTVQQLESTNAFRTNIGAVNIAGSTASVTWRLHDSNNALVASITSTMPPYAVIAPTNMVGFFNAQAADLSDAWISFTSTNPILAYASVVDNATTDPTSIPAQRDTGDTPADSAVLKTSGAFWALNVSNMNASVAWYSEKLGLKVVLQNPRSGEIPAVTVLEGGQMIVELIQRDDATPPGSTPRHGFTKVGVVVDDFDRVIATLTSRGVPMAFGPFPARPDQRANAIIRDNAGNMIQIFGAR